MAFSLSLSVFKKAWLADPTIRWDAGLQKAGLAYTAEMGRYPINPSETTYARTKTLARKSVPSISSKGRVMELRSVHYGKLALVGVGMFGPNHAMIVPKFSSRMAWVGRGGIGYTASAVKGYIWDGKLEKVKNEIRRAFKEGVKNYHG